MLQAGDKAPDFELPDQNGDPVKLSNLKGQTVVLYDQNGDPVKLSNLKGQTVVLYFYPRADTAINSTDLP